jgi:hypothetical protein
MADEPIPTHFAYPFRWDTMRHAAVNEQDSQEDVVDSVICSVMTPRGWRADTPEFGVTDLTFGAPVDVDLLMSEIDADEPRASPILQAVDIGEDVTRDEFVATIRMAL